jgi:hypothetical protein
MNPDGTESFDAVDLLLKVGIFFCFVVFAVCLWVIRRQRDKEKRLSGDGPEPPKLSKG